MSDMPRVAPWTWLSSNPECTIEVSGPTVPAARVLADMAAEFRTVRVRVKVSADQRTIVVRDLYGLVLNWLNVLAPTELSVPARFIVTVAGEDSAGVRLNVRVQASGDLWFRGLACRALSRAVCAVEARGATVRVSPWHDTTLNAQLLHPPG